MNLQRCQEIAADCRSMADEIDSDEFSVLIRNVYEGVRVIGRAASGSWIGYQAYVYYVGFQIPPPGDHFSSEWGFEGSFNNPSSGNWAEISFEDVEAAVNDAAGNPDVTSLENRSNEVSKAFSSFQTELVTLLTIALETTPSETLEELRDKAKKLDASFTVSELAEAQMPRGQIISRDSLAISQGLRPPHHIAISCSFNSTISPFNQIGELANVAETASNYMRQKFAQAKVGILSEGTVFIGHGRSHDWQELSAFIGDRLSLKWDEFNREPTAGLSIKERLENMLGQANFAFLIMTAEDEHTDATLHARENVIHEIGLFQGRLGFNRAIILLEDGCQEFSNVHGIGQIRYPKGYIKSTYEEIRRVLEREGVLAE